MCLLQVPQWRLRVKRPQKRPTIAGTYAWNSFARDTIKAYQNMYPTEESLRRLLSVLVKNGTYITPTLSVYQIPADYQAISARQDAFIKVHRTIAYFFLE
jgi:hypothetical protein